MKIIKDTLLCSKVVREVEIESASGARIIAILTRVGGSEAEAYDYDDTATEIQNEDIFDALPEEEREDINDYLNTL